MTAFCPYCSLAKKRGELFCSRHATNMDQLQSGVFYIEAASFEECDWHVTRLSLNFNLDDKQPYRVGNRTHVINPQKYLLLNEGQSFKTFAASPRVNRMITVAFQVGLANQIAAAMQTSEAALFERNSASGSLMFPETTYRVDETIRQAVERLIAVQETESDTQNEIEDLLAHVLHIQLGVRKQILSIDKVKASTREEIYKRMHWSLDFLHDNYADEISIERLAEQSCLSHFHFKRLFRQVIGIPPYQY